MNRDEVASYLSELVADWDPALNVKADGPFVEFELGPYGDRTSWTVYVMPRPNTRRSQADLDMEDRFRAVPRPRPPVVRLLPW